MLRCDISILKYELEIQRHALSFTFAEAAKQAQAQAAAEKQALKEAQATEKAAKAGTQMLFKTFDGVITI